MGKLFDAVTEEPNIQREGKSIMHNRRATLKEKSVARAMILMFSIPHEKSDDPATIQI